MNIWIISDLVLLWMVLWTFVYNSLCKYLFLFFMDRFLEVELLYCMVSLYLTSYNTAELLSEVWGFLFLHLTNIG